MEKTCGNCQDFMESSERCGNPMVYIDHEDNFHKTTAVTKACGFFIQEKNSKQEEKTVEQVTEKRNTRYAAGEKLLTVCFHYNGQADIMSWGMPYRFNMDKPSKMDIVELEVIEHHKVPSYHDPEKELTCDGFKLKDTKGHIWHNQYPTASYGQISDDGDRTFHRYLPTYAEGRSLQAAGLSCTTYLLSDFYGNIVRGITALEDPNAQNKREDLLKALKELQKSIMIRLHADFKKRIVEYLPFPEHPEIKSYRFEDL